MNSYRSHIREAPQKTIKVEHPTAKQLVIEQEINTFIVVASQSQFSPHPEQYCGELGLYIGMHNKYNIAYYCQLLFDPPARTTAENSLNKRLNQITVEDE